MHLLQSETEMLAKYHQDELHKDAAAFQRSQLCNRPPNTAIELSIAAWKLRIWRPAQVGR